MRNFVIIIIFFFITSCTTGSNLINENKIYIGMSKSALCNVLLWKSSIDEDACMEGSKSKYNPLTKKEFIWGKQGKTYYIIKNKNSSSESGILESWTNSYLTALERIKPKNDIKIKPINDIEILGAGS